MGADGDTPRSPDSAETTARKIEEIKEAMEHMEALKLVKSKREAMKAELTELNLQEKAWCQNDPEMSSRLDAMVTANDRQVSNKCKGALDNAQNGGIINAAVN